MDLIVVAVKVQHQMRRTCCLHLEDLVKFPPYHSLWFIIWMSFFLYLCDFLNSDGGTNLWENAWRMCVDRLHAKKSQPVNPETPLQSQSGTLRHFIHF